MCIVFFFNDTATTEIYTLSLHDALPISRDQPRRQGRPPRRAAPRLVQARAGRVTPLAARGRPGGPARVHGLGRPDRKSTRLNSSHANISYAVFCLKKKNNIVSIVVLINF